MSDYLWDKTGEPDEEVVRLEEMLGGLGHKPRALELPPESAPRTSFFGHARSFRPALFAAAAALLLMMLAGAAVMLRQGGADGGKQSAEANPQVSTPEKQHVVKPSGEPNPSAESPKREVREGNDSATVKGPATPDYQASGGEQKRRPSTPSRGSAPNRRTRQVTSAQEPHVAARQEPPAPTRLEQQAAKAQLVYAMRLASAKLGEVRKMTRGEDAPARSFDERNRIR